MEHITSRKNRIITHLKNLSADGAYRREKGEFVCDGEKLLQEAMDLGASITAVLWGGEPSFELPGGIEQYTCPPELMQHVSPLKNSKGPVFAVQMRRCKYEGAVESAVILENVQDPGNVGTVLRTASAMKVDLVVLTRDCADIYNPKTVRSTMGAIFRQSVIETDLAGIKSIASENGLRLYGAALSDAAEDIRNVDMTRAAVAIGSEGRGLSKELLSLCDGQIIIPMEAGSESLNAAVAASVVIWEMYRRKT